MTSPLNFQQAIKPQRYRHADAFIRKSVLNWFVNNMGKLPNAPKYTNSILLHDYLCVN